MNPGPRPNRKVTAPAGHGKPETLAGHVNQEALEPPQWLSDDARQVFETVARALEAEGLATEADSAALALCATAYSLAVRAAQELELEGIMTSDRAHGGESRKSPAWQVFRESTVIFERLADRFGMSPRARTALPAIMLNKVSRSFLD